MTTALVRMVHAAGATLTAVPNCSDRRSSEVVMTDKKAKVPKKSKAAKPKATA